MGPTIFNKKLLGIWRFLRHLLRPKILLVAIIVFALVFYMQYTELWGRDLLLSSITLKSLSKMTTEKGEAEVLVAAKIFKPKLTFEATNKASGVFSMQGIRDDMEDRFAFNENLHHTDISFFGIFDGHAGETAADYAKDILVQNVFKKIIEITDLLKDKQIDLTYDKKECGKNVRNNNTNFEHNRYNGKCYIKNGKINFGRMLTDEVLAADYEFIENAKKEHDHSGTTVIIALISGNYMTVANVGDCRAVICDGKDNALQITIDHKPRDVRELQRIHEAGGEINFSRNTWRMDGIATTRALGDYAIKRLNRLIALPDIFTIKLAHFEPKFLILGTDGLWDTISSDEAVKFIKLHINEPDFGAKSLAQESFRRRSTDNITVIVVLFKNGRFFIGSSK